MVTLYENIFMGGLVRQILDSVDMKPAVGSMSFLNISVTVEEGHTIMDLYTKPTDTHRYLHK